MGITQAPPKEKRQKRGCSHVSRVQRWNAERSAAAKGPKETGPRAECKEGSPCKEGRGRHPGGAGGAFSELQRRARAPPGRGLFSFFTPRPRKTLAPPAKPAGGPKSGGGGDITGSWRLVIADWGL
jgi:hypothetical protein